MKTCIHFILIVTLISIFSSKSYFNLREPKAGGQHYAVLVAGSNGFWNYRHQSDIFHAYHILLDNGVPKENIIVLAYDDIANDSQNPFPGKVFNKPDPKGKGKDVYGGINIDYKGNEVTPQNFLAILEGDPSKLQNTNSKKVLPSTENDNVFIYFSDHGAVGLIAFPSVDVLYATDLIATLKKMNDKKSYHELVFYLEACESGSMFFNDQLKTEFNIYATTAASPDESSWATYCSPDDVINGISIGSCLGDEYSVNWLEDSDADIGLKKSLQNQYENIKNKTKMSAVQQYGNLSYKDKDIGQYQGNHSVKSQILMTVVSKLEMLYKQFLVEEEKETSLIDSRKAKYEYFLRKSKHNPEFSSEYISEAKHVMRADNIFENFDHVFDIHTDDKILSINYDCLKPSVEYYREKCQWGEYDLKFVRNIAFACNKVGLDKIKEAFDKICPN